MYKHWSQERSGTIAKKPKKLSVIVVSVSEIVVVSFMGMASYLPWLDC